MAVLHDAGSVRGWTKEAAPHSVGWLARAAFEPGDLPPGSSLPLHSAAAQRAGGAAMS